MEQHYKQRAFNDRRSGIDRRAPIEVTQPDTERRQIKNRRTASGDRRSSWQQDTGMSE